MKNLPGILAAALILAGCASKDNPVTPPVSDKPFVVTLDGVDKAVDSIVVWYQLADSTGTMPSAGMTAWSGNSYVMIGLYDAPKAGTYSPAAKASEPGAYFRAVRDSIMYHPDAHIGTIVFAQCDTDRIKGTYDVTATNSAGVAVHAVGSFNAKPTVYRE